MAGDSATSDRRDASLIATFAEALGRGAVESSRWAETLRRSISEARAAWPEVDLDDAAFISSLAACVGHDPEPIRKLASLRAPDVYLTTACARGDRTALLVFEREVLLPAGAMLVRRGHAPDLVDDAMQVVRVRLFTGTTPKIHGYAAKGSLRAWLRAAVLREVLRRLPATDTSACDDVEALSASHATATDPELVYLKRLYGAHVRAALEEAFDRLEPRERNVLRQYYAHRLGIDAIAAIHRIHRATAARWVTQTRNALVRSTRDALARRVSVASGEASSLVRLLQSRLGEELVELLSRSAVEE